MAQYAVLIYADDSAHAPDATADDTATADLYAEELADSGSMLLAYALTPRDLATSIRADGITDGPSSTPRRSSPASTSSRHPTSTPRWLSPAPTRSSAPAAVWRFSRSTVVAPWSSQSRDRPVRGRGGAGRSAPSGVGLLVAATVRVVRDLDLAEECVQEAYAAALRTWPHDGIPANPAAWLTTAARRRGIDTVRRDQSFRAKLPLLVEPVEAVRTLP